MKKKQVTLLELAKRLDLAPSTVSRALNNRHRISEATRTRVKELARKLEYQPNPLAKSLRESKTYTIGVLVPEIANNFFAQAISGIEKTAFDQGYTIVLSQSFESLEREQRVTENMLSSGIDGLLVCPSCETTDFDHFSTFMRRDTPVVFFDRIGLDFEASKIVVDDYDGAKSAVSYLVEKGCKRIAHLAGPEPLSISKARKAGYLEGLKENQLPIDHQLILECAFDPKDVDGKVSQLMTLPNPPDAILAFNDQVGFYTINALKERNIGIPEEVSVICFGGPFFTAHVTPALTTVVQPAFNIGQEAVKLMLSHLKRDDKISDYETVVLKTNLVVRDSSR